MTDKQTNKVQANRAQNSVIRLLDLFGTPKSAPRKLEAPRRLNLFGHVQNNDADVNAITLVKRYNYKRIDLP